MRLKSVIVGLAAGLLMAVAGVALAAESDTLLIEGFDPQNNTLVFGVSPIEESEIDCSVDGSGFTYVAGPDGAVTTLTKGGQPVLFKLVGIDVPYGQTSGICDLTAIDVTGPQGQVNHGQVVSSFVHALKEAGWKGVGCLVRHIAHSDYGKTDGEAVVAVGDASAALTGTVDLTSHEASCNRGNSSHQSEDGEPERISGNGRPNHAGNGRPEGAGHGRPPWAGQGNGNNG